MKKLLLLLIGCLISIGASAQYAVDDIDTLKGSRVFVDGEKVPNADFVAYLTSAYDDSVAEAWSRNRNAYKTGLGLTIAGSSLMFCGSLVFVTGFIAAAGTLITVPILGLGGIVAGDMQPAGDYIDEGMSAAEKMITVGGSGALAGLAMMASGIPVMCVYKKKLNAQFQEYGSGFSFDADLTVGLTANGFGLALNF